MQRHRQTARQTKRQRRSGKGGRQWNKQANKHRTTTWNTSHSAQCRVQRVTGGLLICHCLLPPFPTTPLPLRPLPFLYTHFTQLHFPNISKHFRIVNAVAFYTFLFASTGGGGGGVGWGNWRIKHVRGTICVTWYMTASVELDKCFNEFIFMFCRPLLPSSSPFPHSPGLHYLHGLCHSAIALPFTVGDRDHDICSRGQADTCHMPHAPLCTVGQLQSCLLLHSGA